jgi:eukaryotic-like serine/threonine-protein kinase
VPPSAAPSDSTAAPPSTGAQAGGPATTPATAPTPAPAPAPTQEATTDLHALRQQISQAFAKSTCTLASGFVQDSGVATVSGYAGSGVVDALRQQLTGALGAAPLDWRVRSVDQVFCSALDLLRPIAAEAGAPVSGLSVTLAGGVTTLHDGQSIMPRLTMADFAGVLRVDYLGHDGSVAHLYPTVADPKNKIAARPAARLTPGAPISMGEGGPNQPSWVVGPPYGTDMIIVVASTAPLLTRVPSQNDEDDAGPYLRDLAAGIARVRQAGGQVAGTLLLVDTIAK